MPSFVLVFLGGGLGAVCRYFVTTQVGARFGMVFPFGTLTVNTLGSFLMGLIMGALLFLTERTGLTADPLKLLLTVGFLGGFTTFSSFSMETMTLLRGSSYFYAAANVALNLLGGFCAVWAGLMLARTLVR